MTMIEIARAIDGVSINGKEWLLDENGNSLKFLDQETAVEFLKLNGYGNFSKEELQNSFFFEEVS